MSESNEDEVIEVELDTNPPYFHIFHQIRIMLGRMPKKFRYRLYLLLSNEFGDGSWKYEQN